MTMTLDTPLASLVFVCHNRREMLKRALTKAREQDLSVEIIVMDDASADGTDSMVRLDFPDIAYHRSPVSMGPCWQRNRGVELAKSDYVFPLDDDSILNDPSTIRHALKTFDDPQVAVVALPFINALQSDCVHQTAGGERSAEEVMDFVACAHAVRRSTFLQVGGFNPLYFYMGEEGDLAIRLVNSGWKITKCSAPPIHHMQPPYRKSYRADFYGRRNKLIFYFINAPAQHLPIRMVGTILNGIAFAIRSRCLKPAIFGVWSAFWVIARGKAVRAPVDETVFQRFVRAQAAG